MTNDNKTNASAKSQRKHQCFECKRAFQSSSDLKKHSIVHTDKRPFPCNECEKSFRHIGSLKNHVASQHACNQPNQTLYVCKYCNKSFPIKERLKLHMRTHTGYRPYACSHCAKTFARKGQLTQHARIHTGHKPYACKICGAEFTSLSNLKLHTNRHFNTRTNVCEICGKAFLRPDALRKHLKCTHEDQRAFHCDICNKFLKGHLPQHMRTHLQMKVFGCANCGKRFAQRSQLTVHQRVHSGEKPYRCQVCWKAFAHSSALKLHTHLHTGVKPFKCFLCAETENVAFTQLPHLKKHMLCIHNCTKPYYCVQCKEFFATKYEFDTHAKKCDMRTPSSPNDGESNLVSNKSPKSLKNLKVSADDDKFIVPPMAIEKMRLLLVILLKKISSDRRLEELGFNKRLIDDVLHDSIQNSGREPCVDQTLSDAQRLRQNIRILLEWTIPERCMSKFREERKSTEELLIELTS